MELTSTAYVILGLLHRGPRTGYEIKTTVDRSTRFFWAASYGQIYPELKRLAKAGLVEGLLKLFFAGAAPPERQEGLLAENAAHHADVAERLRAIESSVAEGGRGFNYLVLRFGIELNEWARQWFEREGRELAKEAAA